MIVGHEAVRKRLESSLKRGKVAHAYLFFGPESVGKYAVAKEFAGKLIGETGFARSGQHDPVDLLVLCPEQEEEKGVVKVKDISVEAVRESLRQLAITPYAGKYRVLLVDQAHRLTEAAQNALLKTLEEPPLHAVLILITHRFGTLLPTLVSRCQKEAFQLVPRELMELFMQEKKADFHKAEYDRLADMGRPGLVEMALENDDTFGSWNAHLESLMTLSRMPFRDRLALAETLAQSPQESIRLLEWWQDTLRSQAVQRVDESTHQWFQAMEYLEKTLQMLRHASGGTRLILEDLFLQWTLEL